MGGEGGGSRVGGPKTGAPKGGGPKPRKSEAQKGGRVGSPKFRAFLTLPTQFSFFLPSLGCLRRGILVNPQMCTFGVLGLSCETPAAPKAKLGFGQTWQKLAWPNQVWLNQVWPKPSLAFGRQGFTRQPENSKRAHLSQKLQREDTQRGKKRAKFWPGEGRSPGTAQPGDRPSWGPPFPGTALPLDRPKFRSFLPSLGVFSLNFGGVFEDRGAQMFGQTAPKAKLGFGQTWFSQTWFWPGLAKTKFG